MVRKIVMVEKSGSLHGKQESERTRAERGPGIKYALQNPTPVTYASKGPPPRFHHFSI
jgi:hypothetical protein